MFQVSDHKSEPSELAKNNFIPWPKLLTGHKLNSFVAKKFCLTKPSE